MCSVLGGQVRRAQLKKLLFEETLLYEAELNKVGKSFYKPRV